MTIDLDAAIDRVVELEIEALNALSTPVPSDAKPYFFHWQEEFPYWTNRLGTMTQGEQDEEFDEPEYTLVMRLVIGHLTQDYDGFNEDKLKQWIPHICTYFSQRRWLQTATTSAGLSNLVEARITGCTGFRVLQSVGLPGIQLGCEFNLRCRFVEQIDLTYG